MSRQLYKGLNEAEYKAPHERLSDREYQIFLLIGQGKTVSEISDHLTISISTVNTYRKRILEKTGFSTNAQIIQHSVLNNLL